jgi:hypothetical protein
MDGGRGFKLEEDLKSKRFNIVRLDFCRRLLSCVDAQLSLLEHAYMLHNRLTEAQFLPSRFGCRFVSAGPTNRTKNWGFVLIPNSYMQYGFLNGFLIRNCYTMYIRVSLEFLIVIYSTIQH